MDDVNIIINGEHCNKIETVFWKLCTDWEDDNVSKFIDIFWNEYNYFENKQKQFGYAHWWNVPDVAKNRSHL